MKKLRTLLPLLLFVVVCVFLWKGLNQDPHLIPSPLVNKEIPQFNQNDLIDPGKKLTSKMFIGHISLLNVFASWCGYCLGEHATIMDIARTQKNLTVYGLNYKDRKQDALRWLKKYGNPFNQIIYDPMGSLAINLGVYGTPETFLIDSKGVIRYKQVGPITKEVWHQKLLPQVMKLIAKEQNNV